MNKEQRIQYILNLVAEEIEQLLADDSISLTAEDTVQLALEMVINSTTESIPKKPLVAEIDREQVQYVIDEEFQIPLYGNLVVGEDEDTS